MDPLFNERCADAMILESKCRSMHSLYQELTNLSLPWTMQMLFPWEKFCLRFTDDDLRLTIRFIKDEKRKGNPVRSFNFRTFISGPDSLNFFAEDLAQARAYARIAPVTFKDRVMEGRPKQERRENVRTPGQVLAAAEAFAKFREFSKSL